MVSVAFGVFALIFFILSSLSNSSPPQELSFAFSAVVALGLPLFILGTALLVFTATTARTRIAKWSKIQLLVGALLFLVSMASSLAINWMITYHADYSFESYQGWFAFQSVTTYLGFALMMIAGLLLALSVLNREVSLKRGSEEG